MQPNAAPVECPAAALPLFTVLPPETPTSTVLRAARDLISEPERWAKWGYGFTEKPKNKGEAYRLMTHLVDKATCFCAWGAVSAVMGTYSSCAHSAATFVLKDAIREHTEFIGIPSFNDDPETTHADVLRMFNRAIKKAEDQERLAALH